MGIYKHRHIIVNTKKMTIEWKRGDRIVDPLMVKHYKSIWVEKGLKDKVPFPFVVDNFVLKLNKSDYQVKI